MISQYDVWSTPFSVFVALNWTLTLVTVVAFVATYVRRRFLFVKPSLLLLLIAHLFFQWPLALYAGFYETWLLHPYALLLLVHGFVLITLLASSRLFVARTRSIWVDLNAGDESPTYARAVLILSALCVGAVAIYLSYVPIDCTGLYALMFDPASQPLAREMSMKLQVAAAPRYAIAIIQTGIVPLITAFVATDVICHGFRRPTRSLTLLFLAFSAWCLAFLPGAKGTLVGFGLVITATYFWIERLKLSFTTPLMLLASLAPAVAVATLFTFGARADSGVDIKSCFQRMNLSQPAPIEDLVTALDIGTPQVTAIDQAEAESAVVRRHAAQVREQELQKNQNLFSAYVELQKYSHKALDVALDALGAARKIGARVAAQTRTIVYRAIIVPFEVGGWYVHHFQTKGAIGVAGIPRLSKVLGINPIDATTLIGGIYGPIYYGHPVPPTLSAGASFIFTYYSYFGLWALPVIILCALLTDVAVFVLGLVSRKLVLPVLAALSVATLKFAETDFTTAWLSHGFGVILALGLLLSLILTQRLSREIPASKFRDGK